MPRCANCAHFSPIVGMRVHGTAGGYCNLPSKLGMPLNTRRTANGAICTFHTPTYRESEARAREGR